MDNSENGYLLEDQRGQCAYLSIQFLSYSVLVCLDDQVVPIQILYYEGFFFIHREKYLFYRRVADTARDNEESIAGCLSRLRYSPCEKDTLSP